jgi:uncharacterized protein with NRDE domain
MCVAALAWHAHPRWKLVMAGNRDEFHARPTAALADWGDGLLAGRDLQAGGTWLGIKPDRFALVTNYRVEGYPLPHLASRGALVTDWLRHGQLGEIAAMNPFNLWLVEGEQLHFVTNHPERVHLPLGSGIHGLSNGGRDDRWHKTARLEAALAEWLEREADPAALLDALADDELDPGAFERDDGPIPEFSAVFIRSPEYGTRCSTVLAVDAAGAGTIIERSFDADGQESGLVKLDFRWT